MLCQLKTCSKCGGDLVMDTDEWRCLQCGTYYYPKPSPLSGIARRPEPTLQSIEKAKESRRKTWRARHLAVIELLEAGMPTEEVQQKSPGYNIRQVQEVQNILARYAEATVITGGGS
jgi:hypothetical protein